MSGPDLPAPWLAEGDAGTATVLPSVRGRLLTPSALRRLRSWLKDAEALHLHGVWEPANLQAAAVASSCGTKVFVSLRGMLDDWCMAQGPLRKRAFLALGGRRTLESAVAVHCTAEAEREQSVKWFPRGRAIVIPNLMDLEPYSTMPDDRAARATFGLDPAGPPVVLFLSRISAKKGIEHLLGALALLARRGLRLRTVIAGSGDPDYEARMRRMADDLGPDMPVSFVGHVGGSLKLSLFAASDLFVLPSSQENFGFAFFEALAAGLPVITTDLVDTWKEIESSGAGFIVRQEAHSVADAITDALQDRAELAVRAVRGRAWTLEHLATDRIAARFEAMYGLER
jgi:glycosyltransferase involved in cell wall biosynthesis